MAEHTTDEEWETLKYGSKEPIKVGIKSNNTGRVDMVEYEGVFPRFEGVYMKRDITKLKKGLQEEIMSHVRHGFCRTYGGSGLNPKALASKINGKNIVECMDMTAADLLPFLKTIDDPRGSSLAKQITEYLERMIDVGIGYLSLSRKTETLSGGEAQRLKMVRNLGGYLNNITYIFDEPTAGLHPADAERIGRMLCSLRDKYTNGHSFRVSEYAVALARELGWSEAEIKELEREALLHDIGKIGVPDAVLNKPGRLTNEEFAVIKSHTTIGRGILEGLDGMNEAAKVAAYHHERYDGRAIPRD